MVKHQDGSQVGCMCAVLAVLRDQDKQQKVYAQIILPCNTKIAAKTVKMALNKSMEDLDCKVASQTVRPRTSTPTTYSHRINPTFQAKQDGPRNATQSADI